MVLLLHVLVLVIVCNAEENKRILLNDQDVITTRLHQMESEILSLKSRIANSQQMESEILSLKSQIANSYQNTLELQKLKTEMARMQTDKGAIYTRWGRKTCSGNDTELVYSGITGGGSAGHSGSAAEYVCLPHDPSLLTGETSQNPWGDHGGMYGAEYNDKVFGQNLFNNDVPCAVCYGLRKSNILMIPGKSSCNDGWKKEYDGKLASGSYAHPAASQYVCVDNSPEVLEHGSKDDDGKLFYPVKAICGSLPCPPYKNGALLSCVVCSK